MNYRDGAAVGLSELGNNALTKLSNECRPRDRLDWDDLRVFAVVAECKSLSRAAQVLRVTTGMVSRRLNDLEQRLEVKLFNRTKAGVTLTEAGDDIRDRALSMQRFADAIEGSVRGRDRKAEGTVTIAVPDGLASYWVAPRLGQFLSENPKIQITLDCGGLTRDMGSSPDISITAEKTVADLGDTINPLAMLHYVFLASPQYLEVYGEPQSVAAAAGEHRTLKHVAQTFQREKWGPRVAAIEALATFSLVSNSSAAVVSALLGGAGVATAPSLFCHLYPELQIVGPSMSVPIQLWLVEHKQAQGSARVERAARWLRSLFNTKANPWFRDEFVPPAQFAADLAQLADRLASPTASLTKRKSAT